MRGRTARWIVAVWFVCQIAQAADFAPREIWVAMRIDERPGTGSIAEPFDGSSPAKLNSLFDRFKTDYGDHLVVHFGPGLFLADRPWPVNNNWHIHGAGRDITILKTQDNPEGTATVGFYARCPPEQPWVSGFVLTDLTVDFNVPNLRKANRAFVFFPSANSPQVYYAYAANPPAWSPTAKYDHGTMVSHGGAEYIAIQQNRNREPAQDFHWSILRPIRSDQLPAWEGSKCYVPGDAVAHSGRPYMCATTNTNAPPPAGTNAWQTVNPEAPDPMLYSTAADIWSGYGGGRNEARRVKLLNGHGSSFFGREAFLIKLGGDDCVIEDCDVDLFRGDYSTCLVVFGGHRNVIRGCRVNGRGGEMLFAYGGWENLDNVFENNFAVGVRVGTNIDSLKSRNVIFRNNVFTRCRNAGIGINVGNGNAMDGLFIHDNFIELEDGAELAGIQVGHDGLNNVRIVNNTIRTVSGQGRACAIAVASNTRQVTVVGNTCEPGMRAQVPPHAVCRDNYDLTGRPIPGVPGRADRQAGESARTPALSPATDPQPAAQAADVLSAALGPEGEIADWLVLGPFPHPPQADPSGISLGAGYGFDFLAALGGETGSVARTGDSVLIRFPNGSANDMWSQPLRAPFRAAWRRAHADDSGFTDVTCIQGMPAGLNSTCVYAYCIVRSAQPQRVVLRLGSDDGYVLFANGRKLGEVRDDRRGCRRDQNAHELCLRAGDNPILLKVANYWGGFGWCVRVTDSAGRPASDAHVMLP